MSSLVVSPAEPRSAGARTLVLGVLVAVLTVGVLAMHGLASAETPALTLPTADVAAHADESHGTGDHHGEHDGLGHLGAICLWLAISGAVVLAAAELGRRWARQRATDDTSASSGVVTDGIGAFGRAPPLLLAGHLRC